MMQYDEYNFFTLSQMRDAQEGSLYLIDCRNSISIYKDLAIFCQRGDLIVKRINTIGDIYDIARGICYHSIVIDHNLASYFCTKHDDDTIKALEAFITIHNSLVIPYRESDPYGILVKGQNDPETNVVYVVDGIPIGAIPEYTFIDSGPENNLWTALHGVWELEVDPIPESKPVDIMAITRNMLR